MYTALLALLDIPRQANNKETSKDTSTIQLGPGLSGKLHALTPSPILMVRKM
jgi:hypothetical protein